MKSIVKNFIILIFLQVFIGVVYAQTTPPPVSAPQAPQTGLVPIEPSAETAKKEEPTPGQTVLKLSPSLMIKPFGVDQLNTYGPWVALEPSIEFSSDFFSATKRKLGLTLGYGFVYQQYLNQDYESYFEHDITANVSHSLTERLSATIAGLIALSSLYLNANQGYNINEFNVTPGLKYKLTDKLKVGLGYYMYFNYQPHVLRTYDQLDSITNPPSDISEVVRGVSNLYSSQGTGYSGYSYYYPSLSVTEPDLEVKQKFFLQGITMDLSYKFLPTTSGTFQYHYYGFASSNNDESEYAGHQFFITLDQDLWKGGHLNLQYRLRRRDFKYAFTELENYKVDYRHRIYVNVSHTINDYLSIESDYKLEYWRSNAVDPSRTQAFYVGVKLSL